MCMCAWLCLTLCGLMDCGSTRLFCPWNSPDANTGAGCYFLLQGIFLTQGSNLHHLHLLQWWGGGWRGRFFTIRATWKTQKYYGLDANPRLWKYTGRIINIGLPYWQSIPAFLPGKTDGQKSLAGYHPKGCKESNMTEWSSTHII